MAADMNVHPGAERPTIPGALSLVDPVFERAEHALAEAHDLAETPDAYAAVTRRIDCHRYLARSRMAR